MFSLAPFKYRNIFSTEKGPVDKVWVGEISILGEKAYQANARLRPDLTPNRVHCEVYGNNDGTGSHTDPVIAQHMAISEALERWAFMGTQASGEGHRYRFDIDPSSNGMAAFPGFKWQAQRRARMEALERFALIGWWNGNFGATRTELGQNVGVVRIDHGTNLGEVALVYRKSPNGSVSYGHAASSKFPTAIARATVEMVRSEFVLKNYRAAPTDKPITNTLEKRCLYFSTPEGHAEFLRRLTRQAKGKPAPWRVLFDGEVVGPWSQWATVWRCVAEMPSYEFLDPKSMCFFW